METLRKLRCTRGQVAHCGVSMTKPHEKIVQNGLAITPRDVKTMTSRGIPVATQNQNNMFYNDSDLPGFNPDLDVDPFFVEPQYRRGADMNTMWEISKSTGRKMIGALKRDKQIYG